MKLEYKLTVRLSGETGVFFGPGPAQLFALVREHASLHRAAGAMNMSYSKAMRIVKDAEAAMGEPMLVRTRGGSDGGGSTLTEAAERLLARYRAFEAALHTEGDRLCAHYFAQDNDEGGSPCEKSR